MVMPLDDAWDSYAQLVSQDGHPVVAQLRILPRPHGRTSWGLITAVMDDEVHPERASDDATSIEVPGEMLPADPPEGGLTSRALRNVHLGQALEMAYEVLGGWLGNEKDGVVTSLSSAGFTADAARIRRRPGRKGRGDRYYATVAAAYVDALRQRSRQPVVDAARTLTEATGGTYKASYVRDLLHVARTRGLLTRPPKGRAGGELTEKGRTALREEEM